MWAKQGVQVESLSNNALSRHNIVNVLDDNKLLANVEGVYYVVSGNTIGEDSRRTLEQINSLISKLGSVLK